MSDYAKVEIKIDGRKYTHTYSVTTTDKNNDLVFKSAVECVVKVFNEIDRQTKNRRD